MDEPKTWFVNFYFFLGADEIGVDIYLVGQLLAPAATALGKNWSFKYTIFLSSEIQKGGGGQNADPRVNKWPSGK